MTPRHVVHLVSRFVASLDPRPLPDVDESWALEHLIPGEQRLWAQLSLADRRHAVGVARRVVDALGIRATRPVVAAALLHDVGKIVSGFGTARRVLATVAAGAVGRHRLTRTTSRLSDYLTHDELGAALLADAGSDALTVAWAAEHHRSESGWTVDEAVATALKEADDD